MALGADAFRAIFVTKSGLLDQAGFDASVREAESTRRPLEGTLRDDAYIDEEQYLQLLSTHFDLPSTPLKAADIDPEVMRRLPQDFALGHDCVAFAFENGRTKVALLDPNEESLRREISWRIGGDCDFYVTSSALIQRAFILYDGNLEERVARLGDGLNRIGAAGVSTEQLNAVVDDVVETAVLLGASDVHIEPYETEILVRFRIDGLLQTIVTLPAALRDAVASIVKVRSGLRLDQKRLPQDGRFNFDAKGQLVNLRVSVLPSMWGEKIVLRLLLKNARSFSLSSIGLLPADLALINDGLKEPNGMILVTGPTNSGKSSSLYAFLQQISRERIDTVNISTVEDPIEYTIPRVTQVQINPAIELTFAAGLRALLRQDPDILMVGEIRDPETAHFAVQAALVGRLVLSSLHTNDAPASVPRLLDMGAEPYLLSSTLKLVIAQRLARRLCKYCRQSYAPTEAELAHLGDHHDMARALRTLQTHDVIARDSLDGARFYKAVGCDRCNKSGYAGRIGLFEIMSVSDSVVADINARRDATTIRETAQKEGLKTLFEDGLAKVILGEIDLGELLRVVYS